MIKFASSFLPSLSQIEIGAKCAAGWVGAESAKGIAHCIGPDMIKANTISIAQAKFGSTAGYFIGQATAPAAIAQTMPAVLTGAGILGGLAGLLGYQGTKFACKTMFKTAQYIVQKVQHDRDSKNYVADTTSVLNENVPCTWGTTKQDDFAKLKKFTASDKVPYKWVTTKDGFEKLEKENSLVVCPPPIEATQSFINNTLGNLAILA